LLNNILSLMDGKECTISKKGVDDKTIISKAKFIFISNYPIPTKYPMFSRRIQHLYIDHAMHTCTGCGPPYIPDNQLGLFDVNGEQILIDLQNNSLNENPNFTLDLSDENAHDQFILTPEEIDSFFSSC